MIITIAFLILGSLNFINCESHSPMSYLAKYGYIEPDQAKLGDRLGRYQDRLVVTKAIADFQSFANLEVTGEMDEETLHMMALPRCGVKDQVGSDSDKRMKRYSLVGNRWKSKLLYYRISNYPRQLTPEQVDSEIARAFTVWSKYTDLRFKPSKGRVQINIRFVSGDHGDGDSFDGPSGTLAHAFYPIYGGATHFDAAENWSIASRRGINLFQVAAHEFGHALGLDHSDIEEALMAPFYRGYQSAFKLHRDDIKGIQAIYGRKESSSQNGRISDDDESNSNAREELPSAASEDSILCTDTKIDTIFATEEGSTYVFKGDNYWKLPINSRAQIYPKIISNGWPGLPGSLDAAVTYYGKTFFFKGDQYWRYRGRIMDGDYPKKISEGFPGIPDDLDTVMVWSGNGKLYFIKGSQFWMYQTSQRQAVKSTYPKPISNWIGVPDYLDGAFQYTNGHTYFFKDDAYYRFNDNEISVAEATPPFPRSVGKWWFGCKSDLQETINSRSIRGLLFDYGSDYYGLEKYANNNTDDVSDTDFEQISIHGLIDVQHHYNQESQEMVNGSDHLLHFSLYNKIIDRTQNN